MASMKIFNDTNCKVEEKAGTTVDRKIGVEALLLSVILLNCAYSESIGMRYSMQKQSNVSI